MSTFEIVRGVEGDCLVLDGTRICGPKPWGGGRIIDTFCTDGIYEVIDKDEYRKLMAENAKLRELEEQYETVLADYRSEVVKLRRLVMDYDYCILHVDCAMCKYKYGGTMSKHCPLSPCFPDIDELSELGVEVDE